MSTPNLVQIPLEESYEEKSSEYKETDLILADDDNDSSASETFIHHNDKTTKKDIHSPQLTGLSKLLSPSRKSLKHDLIRIVSPKECEILKTNIINILKENNYDITYNLNISEFITIFKKIFHTNSSQNTEITKFFNLLQQNDALSFDYIINNDSNFLQLLDFIGCIVEVDYSNGDGTRESISGTISVKQQVINNKNYIEYIEYQREIIEQQRNEINNIYKPMILQNKDMEIKISALTNENITLKNENHTLKHEIELLEKEMIDNDSSETDINSNMNELQELYTRRISQSTNMYIEIQESHTFLENEIQELHNNLKLTKSQTDQTMDENYKLREINNKYRLLNTKLTNKYNKLNKELNDIKLKFNNKTNEINRLKYEIFSKEQSIETINNLYNDTLLQLQFYQKNNVITPKYRKKLNRNSFELKINSIPSIQSNHYSYNSHRNHSKHHSEFDMLNDLLLQSPNNYSRPITPCDKHFNDDLKEKLIVNLKNDYNKLQQKYDYDIIQIRIDLEKEIRKQIKKENKNIHCKCCGKLNKKISKSIGVQTKQIGWFERLLSEIKCMPMDENDEW